MLYIVELVMNRITDNKFHCFVKKTVRHTNLQFEISCCEPILRIIAMTSNSKNRLKSSVRGSSITSTRIFSIWGWIPQRPADMFTESLFKWDRNLAAVMDNSGIWKLWIGIRWDEQWDLDWKLMWRSSRCQQLTHQHYLWALCLAWTHFPILFGA